MSTEVTAYGLHPQVGELSKAEHQHIPPVLESLYLGGSWVWDGLHSIAGSHSDLLRYHHSEGGVEQFLVLHGQHLVAHFRANAEFYRTDGTWWEDLVAALVRYPGLTWVVVGS